MIFLRVHHASWVYSVQSGGLRVSSPFSPFYLFIVVLYSSFRSFSLFCLRFLMWLASNKSTTQRRKYWRKTKVSRFTRKERTQQFENWHSKIKGQKKKKGAVTSLKKKNIYIYTSLYLSKYISIDYCCHYFFFVSLVPSCERGSVRVCVCVFVCVFVFLSFPLRVCVCLCVCLRAHQW